jgi:hypothetical protein
VRVNSSATAVLMYSCQRLLNPSVGPIDSQPTMPAAQAHARRQRQWPVAAGVVSEEHALPHEGRVEK